MAKQLKTAMEARRWMVANPWKEIVDTIDNHWRWNSNVFLYEGKGGRGGCWVYSDPENVYAPFTIIDEPTEMSPLTAAITEKAREATAEAAKRFEAAKKQPEVTAFINETANDPVMVEMLDRLAKNDGPQTDPQDGTLYSADWVGKQDYPDGSVVITGETETGDGVTLTGFQVTAKKQPEWVRVSVNPYASGVTQSTYHRIAESATTALQHICQHAQEVRITWPEWSSTSTSEHKIYRHFANEVAMEIFFALQIGAVVEYLPKEGK